MLVKIIVHNLLMYVYIFFSVPLFGLVILIAGLLESRKHVAHNLSRVWLRVLLFSAGVGLEVEGLEKLKRNKAYIFAANHQSQFDIPALEVGLPFQIRWMAKDSLFKIPIFGWCLKVIGYIPVNRENPREGIKSLLAAAKKVQEGFSIVIFPEGTRSSDGNLLPFKPGGFILAIKSRCPIVPIGILGTRDIMPKGRLWVTPGRIKLRIMEPIETTSFSLKEKDQLASLVRQKIEEAIYSPSMYLCA